MAVRARDSASRSNDPSAAPVPAVLDSVAVHNPGDSASSQADVYSPAGSAKSLKPPQEDGVTAIQADAAPKIGARQRWQQAFRDVQAARHHLRDLNGGRPVGGEELWQVYGNAGARLTADHEAAKPQKCGGSAWWNGKKDLQGLYKLLVPNKHDWGSWLNILLILTPIGWAAHFAKWDAYSIFIINLIALIPLATLIGKITEDLALRFGDTIGGLLNVTFGNAVELILSIVALLKNLYDLVTYSLIGSVLSNLLLVLGSCFFLGGIRYKEQTFNAQANKASASLLFLAAIALTIPSAGKYLYGPTILSESEIQSTSYTTAIILALVYIGYLFFQLKTHTTLFIEEGIEEEEDEPLLSIGAAVTVLGTVTVLVAFASEWLTDAITEVSQESGISFAFLGLIIIPIAGNAVEHITAVFVAVKNKMDLAIAVALGSSIQISVFVIPVIVLVGWATNHHLSIAFDPFLVLVLVLSVIHAQFVSSDGRSNWMMGLQLIGTYVLIAVLIAHVNLGAYQQRKLL
ncbi:hypothetical protein WJX73_008972 [Symbiochloris irregularis]|uniref:Vacuolar cation/proton exchanger n=1 Tax=Symbiochloris irregularis TaxID=706552 RepID=A0AAW1PRW9_9CHLO